MRASKRRNIQLSKRSSSEGAASTRAPKRERKFRPQHPSDEISNYPSDQVVVQGLKRPSIEERASEQATSSNPSIRASENIQNYPSQLRSNYPNGQVSKQGSSRALKYNRRYIVMYTCVFSSLIAIVSSSLVLSRYVSYFDVSPLLLFPLLVLAFRSR
jgi:hypothetical protein